MVTYKCNGCGKIFDHKANYNRHINRKKPCKNDKDDDFEYTKRTTKRLQITTEQLQKTTEQSKITVEQPQKIEYNHKQCQYCGKTFARPYNLTIHLKSRCKIKKQNENEKENLLHKLIENLEKQNEEIKKQSIEMAEMKQVIRKLESENKKYVQKISKQQNNNINTQNNTNIDNQQNILINNNNIKLLAFGKEDMTHLADEVCKKILNK